MNCSHVSAHKGRRSSILLKVQSKEFNDKDINVTCGNVLLTKQSDKCVSDSILGIILNTTGATVRTQGILNQKFSQLSLSLYHRYPFTQYACVRNLVKVQ